MHSDFRALPSDLPFMTHGSNKKNPVLSLSKELVLKHRSPFGQLLGAKPWPPEHFHSNDPGNAQQQEENDEPPTRERRHGRRTSHRGLSSGSVFQGARKLVETAGHAVLDDFSIPDCLFHSDRNHDGTGHPGAKRGNGPSIVGAGIGTGSCVQEGNVGIVGLPYHHISQRGRADVLESDGIGDVGAWSNLARGADFGEEHLSVELRLFGGKNRAVVGRTARPLPPKHGGIDEGRAGRQRAARSQGNGKGLAALGGQG